MFGLMQVEPYHVLCEDVSGYSTYVHATSKIDRLNCNEQKDMRQRTQECLPSKRLPNRALTPNELIQRYKPFHPPAHSVLFPIIKYISHRLQCLSLSTRDFPSSDRRLSIAQSRFTGALKMQSDSTVDVFPSLVPFGGAARNGGGGAGQGC